MFFDITEVLLSRSIFNSAQLEVKLEASGNPQKETCGELQMQPHAGIKKRDLETHRTTSAALTFSWRLCGNRFKHNPAFRLCPCGELLLLLKAAAEADSGSRVSGSVLARGSAHAAGAEQSAGGPGSRPYSRGAKAP